MTVHDRPQVRTDDITMILAFVDNANTEGMGTLSLP